MDLEWKAQQSVRAGASSPPASSLRSLGSWSAQGGTDHPSWKGRKQEEEGCARRAVPGLKEERLDPPGRRWSGFQQEREDPGGQEGGIHPGKGRGRNQTACGLESEPSTEAQFVSFHTGALEHVLMQQELLRTLTLAPSLGSFFPSHFLSVGGWGGAQRALEKLPASQMLQPPLVFIEIENGVRETHK